tara:strand:- start:43 stop:330 length:288 start_codon:yes stop_codon:yes gene_type:complete
MEVLIIILSVAFVISFLINLNQMRKQEQLEDYINDLEESNLKYYELFGSLRSRLGDSYSRMKAIDRLGSFESDDETGYIFKELKDIIKQLHGDIE